MAASDEVDTLPQDLARRRESLEAIRELRDAAADLDDEDLPEVGDGIGPYRIEARVGVGGMGAIYRARDTRLARPVALKVLRSSKSALFDGPEGRERLLREAQAIARLHHPNVIAVYDVGSHGEGVYVAMEFFEGEDLASWRERRTPTLGELLAVFIAAGRGLQAAHDAGLVHRDVKLANILVGEGLDVRVVDFGLARAADKDDISVDGDERIDLLSSRITGRHVVIGTPRFMAPESARGDFSPRADQFGYCVALYLCLYDDDPVLGMGAEDMPTHRPRPGAERVPRALRQVMARGLAPDPEHRFASMAELVEALAPLRTRRRRQLGIVAASVLALGVGLGSMAVAGGDDVCVRSGREIEDVWNPARVSRIESQFSETNLSFASSAWSQVRSQVDSRVDAWMKVRTATCESMVERERTGAELDLQLACLDDARARLDALLTTFESADADVVTHAVAAVSALPAPSRCEDSTVALEANPIPVDPRLRPGVDALRSDLAVAAARRSSGSFKGSLELLEVGRDEVDALAYDPLTAEFEQELGRTLAQLRRHDDAVQAFRRAQFAAERGQNPRLRAEIMLDLVEELGAAQKRFTAAEEALEQARVVIGAVELPRLRARLIATEARLRFADNEAGDALVLYETLLAEFPNFMGEAALHHEMGLCLDGLSRYPEAIEHFEAALPLREQTYGETHPLVADTLTGLASSLIRRKRLEEAETALQRALRLREAAFGPDSGVTADIHSKLGLIDYSDGDHEAAAAHLERAVAIVERDTQSIDFDAAPIYSNLGVVYSHQERPDEAIAMHVAALRLLEESVGPTHRRTVIPLMNLGYATRRAGRNAEAITWFRRARELELKSSRNKQSLAQEIAELYIEEGKLEDAERELVALRDRYAGAGQGRPVRVALGFSDIDLARGKPQAARDRLEPWCGDGVELDKPVPKVVEARCVFGLARSSAAIGDGIRGAKEHARAQALAREAVGVDGRLVERRIDGWRPDR